MGLVGILTSIVLLDTVRVAISRVANRQAKDRTVIMGATECRVVMAIMGR